MKETRLSETRQIRDWGTYGDLVTGLDKKTQSVSLGPRTAPLMTTTACKDIAVSVTQVQQHRCGRAERPGRETRQSGRLLARIWEKNRAAGLWQSCTDASQRPLRYCCDAGAQSCVPRCSFAGSKGLPAHQKPTSFPAASPGWRFKVVEISGGTVWRQKHPLSPRPTLPLVVRRRR